MFFLWVNSIKIKKIKRINLISWPIFKLGSIDFKAVSLINTITSTVIVANIEESEEYLKIKETISQVNINKKLNPYDKANKIPK